MFSFIFTSLAFDYCLKLVEEGECPEGSQKFTTFDDALTQIKKIHPQTCIFYLFNDEASDILINLADSAFRTINNFQIIGKNPESQITLQTSSIYGNKNLFLKDLKINTAKGGTLSYFSVSLQNCDFISAPIIYVSIFISDFSSIAKLSELHFDIYAGLSGDALPTQNFKLIGEDENCQVNITFPKLTPIDIVEDGIQIETIKLTFESIQYKNVFVKESKLTCRDANTALYMDGGELTLLKVQSLFGVSIVKIFSTGLETIEFDELNLKAADLRFEQDVDVTLLVSKLIISENSKFTSNSKMTIKATGELQIIQCISTIFPDNLIVNIAVDYLLVKSSKISGKNIHLEKALEAHYGWSLDRVDPTIVFDDATSTFGTKIYLNFEGNDFKDSQFSEYIDVDFPIVQAASYDSQIDFYDENLKFKTLYTINSKPGSIMINFKSLPSTLPQQFCYSSTILDCKLYSHFINSETLNTWKDYVTAKTPSIELEVHEDIAKSLSFGDLSHNFALSIINKDHNEPYTLYKVKLVLTETSSLTKLSCKGIKLSFDISGEIIELSGLDIDITDHNEADQTIHQVKANNLFCTSRQEQTLKFKETNFKVINIRVDEVKTLKLATNGYIFDEFLVEVSDIAKWRVIEPKNIDFQLEYKCKVLLVSGNSSITFPENVAPDILGKLIISDFSTLYLYGNISWLPIHTTRGNQFIKLHSDDEHQKIQIESITSTDVEFNTNADVILNQLRHYGNLLVNDEYMIEVKKLELNENARENVQNLIFKNDFVLKNTILNVKNSDFSGNGNFDISSKISILKSKTQNLLNSINVNVSNAKNDTGYIIYETDIPINQDYLKNIKFTGNSYTEIQILNNNGIYSVEVQVKSKAPNKLTTGQLVGIIVGSIAGLALIIVAGVFIYSRYQKKKYTQSIALSDAKLLDKRMKT